MRHFSKLMLIISTSIISFTSCYENILDMPAEKLSEDKVHAQIYVSLNYDDAVFAGNANISNRRFIVEARDAESTESVIERKEIIYNTSSTLTEGFERLPIDFELDQKKYVVSVWMDYIETGTDKDFYYNTEDLSNISMITPESTAKVHRDALAATQTIDLTEQNLGTEFAVNAQLLSRVTKWQLIANDWKNLLVKKGDAAKTAIINVSYNSGVAKGFNLYTSSAVYVQEGFFIESPINAPSSDENAKITLAEDYIFTSQDEENVSLTVNVKSDTGDTWYTKNDISIACNAGKENKSESNYLTGEEPIKNEANFEGKGTQEEPYLIKCADDLSSLMLLINEGNKDFEYQTAYYKQTADIDLSLITNGISIGNDEYPFKGTYDGNGSTISNNQGLFGVIEDATIKGVKLINCTPDATLATAGIICNSSKGKSSILNSGCEFNAIETKKATALGCICGEVVNGTLNINVCRAKGNSGVVFKATNNNSTLHIGGFIGKINADCCVNISDSYYSHDKNIFASNKQTDNCIGGLCGLNNGTLNVERCYVIAKIQSGGATAFGGIIVGKGTSNANDCYTKDKNIYGGKETEWIKNESIDNTVKVFSTETWPSWDTTIWEKMGDVTTSTFPTLKWENE
ncbi:DUF6562 domain-containing protein [Bacteroides sp.]|uniref:DUF6562 domain-containing protein n=1 Tax=Bacteroides sp. TaxID=29523 RepID=UPI0025843171|nr:DUF6562 domain-containing protein [Bacteroides sp.]